MHIQAKGGYSNPKTQAITALQQARKHEKCSDVAKDKNYATRCYA